MGALNMSMISAMSLLLGNLHDPNNTVQLQHQNQMSATADQSEPSGSSGDGCCHSRPCCCKTDPCDLDPPDATIDHEIGIPPDDHNLQILLGLKWPLKDCLWFLKQFQFLIESGNFMPRPVTSAAVNTRIKARKLSKPITKPHPVTDKGDLLEINKIATVTNSSEIEEVLKQAQSVKLSTIAKIMEEDTTKAQRAALAEGKAVLEKKKSTEGDMFKANHSFEKGSSSLKHQSFLITNPIASSMANLGVIIGHATLSFVDSLGLPAECIKALPLLGTIDGCDELQAKFGRPSFESCDPDNPYRNLDGSCNNVNNILWGAAFIPFLRDLPADYSDGVSEFRKSVTDLELPSARFISTTINNANSEDSPLFSILLMTYGQFLDHDLTATPLARGSPYPGGEDFPIKCCDSPFSHPECAPIKIPSNDPFYKCHDQFCMEFVRSAPTEVILGCPFGARNQLNQNTAYLDASVVYGNTPDQNSPLRAHIDGLLIGQLTSKGQFLLPRDMQLDDVCNTEEQTAEGRYCFKAGDGRVNEQILLTFFQTLWAREHNRVAKILKECNENWDDEKLFQEARRIVWAQFQQVTYNEFLPSVIGPALMESSKLFPLKGGKHTDDYDETLNAGIANSFASAAYRFGHSLVSDNLLSVTKYGKTKVTELSSLFFNPFELYDKDGVNNIGIGGLNLPEKLMNPYFTLQLAGLLFRGKKPYGLDLLALNIQRGRDHGLPPYNYWRVFCKLPKAHSFADLLADMDLDAVKALKKAYNGHVDDIDLYAGGISEKPLPGAIVGPTFTCLIHNQFFKMKYGDRFWFEYNGSDNPGRFTKAQLGQLHRVTLARIMCNNMPELDYIQRWPLKNPGPDNPKVCCKSIRQYHLRPWKPDCEVEEDNDEDNDHDHSNSGCNHKKESGCSEHRRETRDKCGCNNKEKSGCCEHHHDNCDGHGDH